MHTERLSLLCLNVIELIDSNSQHSGVAQYCSNERNGNYAIEASATVVKSAATPLRTCDCVEQKQASFTGV